MDQNARQPTEQSGISRSDWIMCDLRLACEMKNQLQQASKTGHHEPSRTDSLHAGWKRAIQTHPLQALRSTKFHADWKQAIQTSPLQAPRSTKQNLDNPPRPVQASQQYRSWEDDLISQNSVI